jgi:hypothetical protein
MRSNGALQQDAGIVDQVPAESGKPATLVQGSEEPLVVGGIAHSEIDVGAAIGVEASAGVAAKQAGAGRCARQPHGAYQG